MFVDRKDELQSLEERWKSDRAEFVVFYGRRRVGKTALIDRFIEKKNGLRLLGRLESEKNQLERFSKDVAFFFNDEYLKVNPFQNWDAFFTYLVQKSKNERVIIAIDEFPYVIDSNKSVPSILQDYWDRYLKDSKIFLILCGSSISMMIDKVLGHKSPLYGRRTGQLKIEPFGFFDIFEFFKNYKIGELIYAYSILGGTPAYLLEFEEKLSISENIQKNFLKKDSFLFRDAEFVLREELKEPKFYFSILRAIALGKTKMGEIINETGLEKGIVGKYLSVLSDLDMVKREVPVTEKQKHKSRKGIYVLKDNFYKFWFNFVFPNMEEIERKKNIVPKIMEKIDQYTSYNFEEICKEFVWKKLNFEKVGKWWHKENEIDIVALSGESKEILFCECKWQEKVDARKILEELKQKSKLVDWNISGRKEKFALFAKSFKNKFKEKNVSFYDLKDLKPFQKRK